MKNREALNWVRTLVFLLGAGAVGILGITGATGFAVYGVLHILVSIALLVRMNFKPHLYTDAASPLSFLAANVFDNLVSFILFWTLAYALVHIY